MKLWLSMIIRNESENIKKHLYDIYDLFDDIVVVDTGSTDDSTQLLKDIGIAPLYYDFSHSDERLIEARNFSIEKNNCDRILILDGDEKISREDIIKIKSYESPCWSENVFGYFIKWIDHRYETVFEDYKMCLINKKHVRFLFSVHACPQVYIRDNGWIWLWMNGISLHHYPEERPYRELYIQQLENGIKENPWCLRFYWFMWYYYFKHNKIDKAREKFEFIIKNANMRYPVEVLNATMILASIEQNQWETINSFCHLSLWLDYYEKVKDDFEVKINFRVKDWFLDAHRQLLKDQNTKIYPYEFAY